jgi:hypothetical protein
MKTREIAVTDLRPGLVIVENKGTKHEKQTTVRRLDACTRRGFVHVNGTGTDRGTKGGHALCFDLIGPVHVTLTDQTETIPVFAPTVVLGED